MSLKTLMAEALPLNRKEKYYTGTVLPMIACRDGFRHFGRFTSLIDGFPNIQLDVRPTSANVQFFTEYSFVESLNELSRTRFTNIPVSKDTPDLVMLYRGESSLILAVEAKMYSSTNRAKLERQMASQVPMLECVAESLGVEHVVHCALLPAKLTSRLGELPFPVITWESVCETYEPLFPDDYFIGMLRLALDSYDDLAAVPSQYGANCEAFMCGREIYDRFNEGTLKYTYMGRKWGGLRGRPLMEDLATGEWQQWPYEVHSRKEPSTGNWFAIADFVAKVDRATGRN